MKPQILPFCIVFCLCWLTQNVAFAQTPTPTIVGNDRDAHGCIPSAGYTWSVVKEACIRVFEDGHRLNAKAKGLSKTTSAFIVFRSTMNQAQAELFLPKGESIILTSNNFESNTPIWKNKKYILKKNKDVYSLYSNKNKLLYLGK